MVKIFITMLALKDREHIVRFSAFALGQRAHKTEAEVLEALKILAAPDTRRLEPQPFDGRRIEKVEGGWLILNGKVYEDLMREMSRRAYKRQKEAEYRSDRARRKRLMIVPPGGAAEKAFVKAFGDGTLDSSTGEIWAQKTPAE